MADGYWIKCPYCETIWDEVTAVWQYEDESIKEDTINVEYATHYCPNCHSFQRTWALEGEGNEDKVILFPWGAEIYMSQWTLLGLSGASWTGAAAGAAEMIWASAQAPRLLALVEGAYFSANKINFPGVTEWQAIGRPNPLENPIDYFKLAQRNYAGYKAGRQVFIICLALAAVGALLSWFYDKGMVITIGLQANLKSGVRVKVGVRGQRAEYGIPICMNCLDTLPFNEEFEAGEDLSSPYVNMEYGNPGGWLPDYIKQVELLSEFEDPLEGHEIVVF
jgi:hypothetical protein